MISRVKMCQNKVSFRTKGKAETAGRQWGQRVYECPICFCWHCTTMENWRDEFVTQDEAKRQLRELEQNLRREYNDRLREKNSKITELERKVKRLKYGEEE